MAISRKSPPSNAPAAALAAALHRWVAPRARLVLGLSGGIDSVVLLHALAHSPARGDFDLACVHVHHGLSANADRWAAFCAAQCDALALPLTVARVQIDRADPAGREAAARTARHRVFAALDADFILTAHHRNDQAETLLLQLLRGAGPAGLAAMAEQQRRPGWRAALLRPLLATPRAAIVAYADAHRLEWVDDESNADLGFDRNYVRHALLPAIETRFPAASATLARSAALQADAAQLLYELARIDADACVAGERIDCAALGALSPARARNLLRWFIDRVGVAMPSARRLDEALRQLLYASDDAQLRVALAPGVELRRHAGSAALVATRDCAAQARVVWRGEARVELPAAGWQIAMLAQRGAGLSRARLDAGRVEFGVRRGGERLRVAANGRARTLKNLLQEAAVPPWQRACIPLLRCDDTLVWAAGIGFDPAYAAGADEIGVVPLPTALVP